MKPTDEQTEVLDLAADQGVVAVEALAGTGKTTTMQMLAAQEARKGRSVLYLAFNKAIATEAGTKMGNTAVARTFHSQAFGAVGKPLAGKLRSTRKSPGQLARIMGLDPVVVTTEHDRRVLRPGYLAGVVMTTIRRFCQSADTQASARHVPWIDGLGDFSREVHAQYAPAVLDKVPAAWADLISPSGILPYSHDIYLKLWQLSEPRMYQDVILFDEAQDASPVMNAIVAQQDHAQVCYVGDSRQEIYGWRGAQNAMGNIGADRTAWLTQSFRFGPDIAEAANRMLRRLDSEKHLIGAGPAGTVGKTANPTVVLFRTNAAAVERAFFEKEQNRRPYIVGGIADVVRFARAARDLMEGRDTYHEDLAPFNTWGEVLEYTANDMLGGELALYVKVVEDFGPDRIEELGRWMDRSSEHDADVVLSTAHKSKGREWPVVQLAGDYPEPRPAIGPKPAYTPPPEEFRLLYVAATRAQSHLDPTAAWPWAGMGA